MKEDLFDYAQYLLKLAVKKTDNFEQAGQRGQSEKIGNLQAYLTGILFMDRIFSQLLRNWT